VGIRSGDGQPDLDFISRKILNARLWPSERKAWDCSVQQKDFEILCVSQFTLYGRLNGNKPDFSQAMSPQPARDLYDDFIRRLEQDYEASKVKDGIFGAMMEVELVNDGPVTFLLESIKQSEAVPSFDV
jgi:D-tyrosyl-tRNA(Tyr) deacylase